MPKPDTPPAVEDKDFDPVESSYRVLQKTIRLSEEGVRPAQPAKSRQSKREDPPRRPERPGAKKRPK